jgi:hypothetical protein
VTTKELKMSNHLKHSCGGTWEPMPRWSGRYRCSVCKAIGYRYAEAPRSGGYNRHGKFIGAPEHIVPYKCSVKGCDGLATHKTDKKWKCKEH